MPAASIRVEVAPHAPRIHGRDQVAILLAPHPGAQHLPVATAASGGELSRVMLALEVALASSREDRSAAPVFVFDEIDAGIGGRAAPCVRFSCSRTQRVRFGLMHETQKFFFPADGKRSFPLPIFFHGASAAAHLRAAAMGSL